GDGLAAFDNPAELGPLTVPGGAHDVLTVGALGQVQEGREPLVVVLLAGGLAADEPEHVEHVLVLAALAGGLRGLLQLLLPGERHHMAGEAQHPVLDERPVAGVDRTPLPAGDRVLATLGRPLGAEVPALPLALGVLVLGGLPGGDEHVDRQPVLRFGVRADLALVDVEVVLHVLDVQGPHVLEVLALVPRHEQPVPPVAGRAEPPEHGVGAAALMPLGDLQEVVGLARVRVAVEQDAFPDLAAGACRGRGRHVVYESPWTGRGWARTPTPGSGWRRAGSVL